MKETLAVSEIRPGDLPLYLVEHLLHWTPRQQKASFWISRAPRNLVGRTTSSPGARRRAAMGSV
jgi:hypothetical protein